MKKYINFIEEAIYDFLLGFWTPFTFLLIQSFIEDWINPSGEKEISFFMAIITIIIYLILLVPNNIIFFRKKNNINKFILFFIFTCGSILGINLHRGKGIINIFNILLLFCSNLLFLSLNSKSDKLYLILITILNLCFLYLNIQYFSI